MQFLGMDQLAKKMGDEERKKRVEKVLQTGSGHDQIRIPSMVLSETGYWSFNNAIAFSGLMQLLQVQIRILNPIY